MTAINDIQKLWHFCYDKTPEQIAKYLDITEEQLWIHLKGVVSRREFNKRKDFTGYGENRCNRCGIINGSSEKSVNYCKECVCVIKLDNWEQEMIDAGWSKSFLPGIWRHKDGALFDESEKTGDMFNTTLGDFHRQTRTVPLNIDKDEMND